MAEIPVTHTRGADVGAAPFDALRFPGLRMSWGAIFAGLIIAVALEVVFSLLGLAIGLGAIDIGDSARSVGIGAGVWAVLTTVIALFVGGMVTGRVAGPRPGAGGVLHGLVLWGLSTLITVWLVASGVSALAGGAFRMASNVLSGTAAGVSQGAAQVGAAAATRPSDARRAAARADSAAQALRAQAGTTIAEVRTQAGEVALEAKGAAARGAWLALIMLALTAAAAAFGAARGAREEVVRET